MLGSSRILGEAAKYWIDGSEKTICRLSFEFESLRVIEKRSKEICYLNYTTDITAYVCLAYIVIFNIDGFFAAKFSG